MSFPKLSKCFLESVQFNYDPEQIRWDWDARGSVHEGDDGEVTHQDFGMYAADAVLEIISGKNFMDRETVSAIRMLQMMRGQSFTWKDYEGTEGTVRILSFTPLATFYGDLYTYTMKLQILTLTKYLGANYTGD